MLHSAQFFISKEYRTNLDNLRSGSRRNVMTVPQAAYKSAYKIGNKIGNSVEQHSPKYPT